ncbi:uroporphyrin-III C-methyltransferase [Legionella busanensis]|uniref:Uroporphyrin-III C-methyltransferase n=1 Tax=Legionella busanensis TaxID=190655 RepID=A0A378JRR9_9GAMM|nr:uroporphyrinogen-III C-methyltransferase [Legionella busanensis]STX52580.1 uroporphyrin-III C-methyltransferase [Legionella busanensis]
MNNNEELNQSSLKAEKPISKSTKVNETVTSKNNGVRNINGWHIGLLVLTLISLLLAALSFYQNSQLKAFQIQQQIDMADQIRILKSQLQKNSLLINTRTKKFQNLQNNLTNHINKLDNSLQNALKQRFFQNQDWLLLKARYYLELVQLNAHWGEDQQTTAALLQQADQVLQDIPEQQLFSVRQAIAQEISKIKALPNVDTAGLLSQLDAAQSMVMQLPLQQSLINSQQTTSTPTTDNSGWRGQFNNSLSYLKKLVVVRRHEGAAQPIYSPLHQSLLREVIRMNLQEAQWAVLQKNTKVYEQALNQAITAIKNTFDQGAANTQALLKNLQQLQQQKLDYPKPIVDKPLVLLNQYIETRTRPTIPTVAPAPASATGGEQ